MSANSIEFSENSGNWGKMSNILVKWLHYLWLFPNIWGILINLLHFHGDFSDYSGNSYQNTYLCQCKSQKLNVYNCVQKNNTLFFFYPKLLICNYNMMSFLGHPVCHLGLNWCILLGLFIVFFFRIS